MNKQKKQGLTWMAASGAITIVLTWVVREFAQVEIPTEVGQAITMIVAFAGGAVGSEKGRKVDQSDY